MAIRLYLGLLFIHGVTQAQTKDTHPGTNDMVLLKIPLRNGRLPRQQQEVPTSTQAPAPVKNTNTTNANNNQTSESNQQILQPNPGTAVNVGNILSGLVFQDVRPILTGSTAFIPPGNLREGVEALLHGFAPLFQHILFGPGPNAHYQTHHSLPPANQTGQNIQPTANQVVETTSEKAPETSSTSHSISPSQPLQTTESPSPQVQQGSQLKGEVEGSTKQKEYIYLVLRPEEYEELVKNSNTKDKTVLNLNMPQSLQEIKRNTTFPNKHVFNENEDDEYEAFLLNNVTDLHLRDFYFNWTRV